MSPGQEREQRAMSAGLLDEDDPEAVQKFLKATETVAVVAILAVCGLSSTIKGVTLFRGCQPRLRPLWVAIIFFEVEVCARCHPSSAAGTAQRSGLAPRPLLWPVASPSHR